MSSFNDIALDAYIANGMLAPGEALDANLAEYARRTANRILDQWAIQSLSVFTSNIALFNITTRTASVYWFTIGQAGGTVAPDFVVLNMPPRINRANLMLTTSSPASRVALELLDDAQWSDETVPALGTAPVPNKLYYDYGNVPNGVDANNVPCSLSRIYLHPYPTSSRNQLELFTPGPIAARFASINDTFNMPAGYEDAFMLTLSERCIEGVREIPATLAQAAARARANVRSLNSSAPKISTTDSGMPGQHRAEGSFYSGWQRSGRN